MDNDKNINKFFGRKDIKIKNMFQANIDRKYILNILFPTIGKYLKENSKTEILEIGVEKYNIYDKMFFENNYINFYALDIVNKQEIIPSDWSGFYNYDLTKNIPENIISKVDIIIDYGVIGWDKVNITLSSQQIEQYIYNVHKLLNNDGFYFLKIDYRNACTLNNDIILKIVYKFFHIAPFYDLDQKTLIQDENIYFETFVLQKNTPIL